MSKSKRLLPAALAVAIVIEDTIVIFHYDVYSSYFINMNSRSVTSDIYYLMLGVFTLFYLHWHRDVQNITSASPSTAESPHLPSEGSWIDTPLYFQFCDTYHLTIREREILQVLLKDKSNLEISNELTISLGTAKTHVHNIFQKIGVTKRQQLIHIYQSFCEERL